MTTLYFVATFADGSKAARSSTSRNYGFAWKVTAPEGYTNPETIGFSSRRDLAQKAGDDHANGWSGLSSAHSYTSKKRPRNATPAYYKYRAGVVAEHGGAEAWVAKATAERAKFRVEVAEVVEVDRKTWEAAR